jgi:hypothetical protein
MPTGVIIMTRRIVLLAAVVGSMALVTPVYAGNGNAIGAGLLGLGIGAVVGSALAPQTVYVAPAPAYAGPAAYGPPPWSPAWYRYCRNMHGPYFDPNTGYFQAPDGGFYCCQ